MIKRQAPKRATLPNSRTFYAKYKRTTRAALPANVHLRRAYKDLLHVEGEGEQLVNMEEVLNLS